MAEDFFFRGNGDTRRWHWFGFKLFRRCRETKYRFWGLVLFPIPPTHAASLFFKHTTEKFGFGNQMGCVFWRIFIPRKPFLPTRFVWERPIDKKVYNNNVAFDLILGSLSHALVWDTNCSFVYIHNWCVKQKPTLNCPDRIFSCSRV